MLAVTLFSLSLTASMRVASVQHPAALARRAVSVQMGLKTPQTVGDAKEAFQEAYGRPVTNVLQV